MAIAEGNLRAARRDGRSSAAGASGPRLFRADEERSGAEASVGRASTIPVSAADREPDQPELASVVAASGNDFQSHGHGERPGASPCPAIEGYAIREILGADGMGTVYRALDLQLQREVALKVPHAVHADARAQFLTEARALARLKHPHVVAVHAVGCAGEQVFLTMDLIDGQDAARLLKLLRERQASRLRGPTLLRAAGVDLAAADAAALRAAGRPPGYFRLAALWVAQAAAGLHAAHCAGILHRDVKPSNLLLTSDGRMLVGDFGLARDMHAPATDCPGVTGTYPYLAPERVTGDWASVDHRADIWALGATLYEFLTFQRAYPRHGVEVLQDIATADPVRPRAIDAGVPTELDRICLRAMRRLPGERYQSAQNMADELRAWAEAAPMQWRRRTALGMAALLALIVLGVLYLSWSGQRPSCPAAPATQPAVSHAVLPAAHDDSFQRPALRSETVPAEPHQPSAPPGSHATLPAAPVVLLAFNEDLNADDDRTPQAGGEAESRFRRAFEQSNPRVPIRTPLAAPAVWNSALAVETARQLGASVALVGELEARPIGRIANVGPVGDTVYRWELRLRTALVRVADEHVERLPDVCAFPTRLEAEQYGGDGIPDLVAEVLPDVCARMSALFYQHELQERVQRRE